MLALAQRDALDLDECASGELGHLHGAARGRLIAEVAGVDLVEVGEMIEVHQEAGRLDDAVEAGPGCGQDRAEVLHHALGLHGDVALDDLAGGRLFDDREIARIEGR